MKAEVEKDLADGVCRSEEKDATPVEHGTS
jgi:hypothetical protein